MSIKDTITSYRFDGETEMKKYKEIDSFKFPEPMRLKKRLKDMLEDEVEEKYYLTDEQVASFKASTARASSKGNGFKFEPMENDSDAPAHTILSRAGSRQTDNFIKVVGKVDAINGHDILKRVYDAEGCSPTISTMGGGNTEPKITTRGKDIASTIRASIHKQGKRNLLENIENGRGYEGVVVPIRTANKKGYDYAIDGDGIDLAYPHSTTRRGRVGHGVAKTLATQDTMGTMQDFRIRKLTPKECWRLMGFADEDFERAKSTGMSNTQLYKQAGNSIVVDVLKAILRNLLVDG